MAHQQGVNQQVPLEMSQNSKERIDETNAFLQRLYSKPTMPQIPNLILERSRNRLIVQLFGATIDTWQIRNKEFSFENPELFFLKTELLFISAKSKRDRINPILGGISVAFPNIQKSNQNMPQVGFANQRRWTISHAYDLKYDYSITTALSLTDNEETRTLWNHKFELNLKIMLKPETLIYIELTIHNKDSTESDFSSLIQAYFKLDNINNAKLHGLKNTNYIDKLYGNDSQDSNEFKVINSETYQVYYDSPNELMLETGNEKNYKIKINKQNCPDIVLWNPWIERSKEIENFSDNEYNNMIYIAFGHAKNTLILKPNESHTMSLELVVENI